MARSRRESHHNDGITDQKNLQRTSATKSVTSRHRVMMSVACPAYTLKADIDYALARCPQYVRVTPTRLRSIFTLNKKKMPKNEPKSKVRKTPKAEVRGSNPFGRASF